MSAEYEVRAKYELLKPTSGVRLRAFAGIGPAVSDDLRTWKKVSDEPVLPAAATLSSVERNYPTARRRFTA